MHFVILGVAILVGLTLTLLSEPASAAIAENPQPDVVPDVPSDNTIATYSGVDSMQLADNNMLAFLAVLRAYEPSPPGSYTSLVGGGQFSDFSDHPANLGWQGVVIGGLKSHAAGAYQFEPATWNTIKRRLNLPDFSPASQDAAAIEDIREHKNATILIEAGRFKDACQALSAEWESLKRIASGNYHGVTIAAAQKVFANSGGVVA